MPILRRVRSIAVFGITNVVLLQGFILLSFVSAEDACVASGSQVVADTTVVLLSGPCTAGIASACTSLGLAVLAECQANSSCEGDSYDCTTKTTCKSTGTCSSGGGVMTGYGPTASGGCAVNCSASAEPICTGSSKKHKVQCGDGIWQSDCGKDSEQCESNADCRWADGCLDGSGSVSCTCEMCECVGKGKRSPREMNCEGKECQQFDNLRGLEAFNSYNEF